MRQIQVVYGGRGITIGTGSASSNLTIANNMISGVNGTNWNTFGNSSAMGIAIGVIGNSSTLTTTTGGINLYYNSVSMAGSMGTGSSSALTAAVYVGSGATALDIRNNIFVNTQTATSTTQKNMVFTLQRPIRHLRISITTITLFPIHSTLVQRSWLPWI